MSPSPGSSSPWHDLTVGLLLPDAAFGAAVDIDGLLRDPELHYAATTKTSRLMLMPRIGTFSRLLLEWETLPEIGVFTVGSLTPSPLSAEQIGRLETWMRDVAVVCHANRDRIRETSERAVRDAASGLDTSLPPSGAPHAQIVSAHIRTSVTGPPPGSAFGVVDVIAPMRLPHDSAPADDGATESGDEMRFVARDSGTLLGRRITHRRGDAVMGVALESFADGVDAGDLTAWYDQHIAREVLFDDVWQVYVHLIAGLDAPSSIRYAG